MIAAVEKMIPMMENPGGLSDGIWVPPRCAFIRGPSPRHARGDAVGLSRKPGIAFDNHTLSPICAGCIAIQLDDRAAVIDAFHRFVGYALDMTRNTGC